MTDTPSGRQKAPIGSYLSKYLCGVCVPERIRFIITEGAHRKTEVCPSCGSGTISQRRSGKWKAV